MSHDSPEFDLAVMTTAHENAIASLVAACQSSAKYQHRAEVAEAALGRVRAVLHGWRETDRVCISDLRAAMKEPKP